MDVEGKRVAVGYARVSTMEQAVSGLSIEHQKRKIVAQCEISNLHLCDVLVDAGYSASSFDRPAMIELLARVEDGQVDTIVIAKLDRLTRSLMDLGRFLEMLHKAKRANINANIKEGDGKRGVDLISTAESLDTSSATGRLVINIMASVAQWEREVIAERTQAAMQELRSQGRTTGNPIFGYCVDAAGVLVADSKEQEILEIIRGLREDGRTWEAIADHLNHCGYQTRNGGNWSKQGVFRLKKYLM